MQTIQVFPDVLVANQGRHGQKLVIYGGPEKGNNYMCSEGAQHQQKPNLGCVRLLTVKAFKRADTWAPFSNPTYNHAPPTPPLFGSPISRSFHKLDEETHISQPVSWPHFIHLLALEDKICYIPLTQQLCNIPENLNPWLHDCGNLKYCNMSYLHKSFVTEMT